MALVPRNGGRGGLRGGGRRVVAAFGGGGPVRRVSGSLGASWRHWPWRAGSRRWSPPAWRSGGSCARWGWACGACWRACCARWRSWRLTGALRRRRACAVLAATAAARASSTAPFALAGGGAVLRRHTRPAAPGGRGVRLGPEHARRGVPGRQGGAQRSPGDAGEGRPVMDALMELSGVTKTFSVRTARAPARRAEPARRCRPRWLR